MIYALVAVICIYVGGPDPLACEALHLASYNSRAECEANILRGKIAVLASVEATGSDLRFADVSCWSEK